MVNRRRLRRHPGWRIGIRSAGGFSIARDRPSLTVLRTPKRGRRPDPGQGVHGLGKDAGGEAALIGTLYWIAQEFGWRADWRFVWRGDHRWRTRASTFDAAFRNALEGSARILSGHGEAK